LIGVTLSFERLTSLQYQIFLLKHGIANI
jgi:hypothetical protein